MSCTAEFRGIVWWHTLHCDRDGCRAQFTVDHTYGHLADLRKLAAAQAGWTSPERGGRTLADERWDFCYQHSVARLGAR